MAMSGETTSQDFSGQDLRGQSFKNKVLEGAKFVRADIRGVDFSGAHLKNADFTSCKAGLTKQTKLFLYIVNSLLLFSVSIISLIINFALANTFSKNIEYYNAISIFVAIAYIFIAIRHYKHIIYTKSIKNGTSLIAREIVIVFLIVGAIIFVWLKDIYILRDFALGSVFSFISIPLNVWSIAIPCSCVVALQGTWLSFLLPITVAIIAGIGSPLLLILILIILSPPGGGGSDPSLAFLIIILFSQFSTILFSAYISWQAFSNNDNFSFVRKIAINFATIGGTNFTKAKLENTIFFNAELKNTNFESADFNQTYFHNAQEVHLAKFTDSSIYSNKKVLNLLVAGEAQPGESYVEMNFEKANFKNFFLRGVNFEKANLTEANFEEAKLQGANLTRVHALGTNFSKASMTGAFIQEWNINSLTNLEYVDCDYINRVRYPKNDPNNFEPLPSSGKFEKYQFTYLYQEIENTIDLILLHGLDWKAFIAAFGVLKIKHKGKNINVKSIDYKGNNVCVIKVKIPPDANKKKIYKELRENYKKALIKIEYYRKKLKINQKDLESYRQMNSEWSKCFSSFTNNHPINISPNIIMEGMMSKQKEDYSSTFKNSPITVEQSGAVLIGREHKNKISRNSNNEISNYHESNKACLKQKLAQLKNEISQENCNDDDKQEALEQIRLIEGILFESNNQSGSKQKLVNRAVKILKGTFSELPRGAAIVTICNQLPELIAKLI